MNYGYQLMEALNEMPEPFRAEAAWQEIGPTRETLRDFAARQ